MHTNCVYPAFLIFLVTHYCAQDALGVCAGCIQQEEGTESAPVLEDYFRGDFVVSGGSILNQEVEILFTVKPITDSPNTEILFYLPEGTELVQGDIYWTGDIKEDEVVEVKIRGNLITVGGPAVTCGR
jgi:hypothetical protein